MRTVLLFEHLDSGNLLSVPVWPGGEMGQLFVRYLTEGTSHCFVVGGLQSTSHCQHGSGGKEGI